MTTLATDIFPTASFGTSDALPVTVARTREDSSETGHAHRLAYLRRDRHRREISCKIAFRRNQLQAAYKLVYEAYVNSGLARPNPFRLRVTPYHLLPTTEVYVAVEQGEVISTVTLVRDGKLGLPMEAIYPEEVALRRMQGISLGEVSCLADKHHERGACLPVVLQLMSFMAQCARRRGVNELVIAVHPRHARFYQRFAAFEAVGDERVYGTVCGNPAVAMSLNLDRAPVDHRRLYKMFFGVPFPEKDLAYRPVSEEVRPELHYLVDTTWSKEAASEGMVLAAP